MCNSIHLDRTFRLLLKIFHVFCNLLYCIDISICWIYAMIMNMNISKFCQPGFLKFILIFVSLYFKLSRINDMLDPEIFLRFQ